MACKCAKNRNQDAQAEKSTDIVELRCESCSDALLSINGFPIPVHLTTVRVTRQQYNAWVAQGFPVELVA